MRAKERQRKNNLAKVTEPITPIDVEVLANERAELPDGWEWATIRDAIGPDGVFIDGDWIESKDQDPNGDVRLVQLADIGDGIYRNRSSRYLTRSKATELGCTFLEPNDVLIARMPDPLGRACIFPGDSKPCVTAVDVCIIRTGKNWADYRWLMYVINASIFRQKIESLQSGTTRQRISRGNLATLKLPLPPIDEQHRIVARIEEFAKRTAEINQRRSEMESYAHEFLLSAYMSITEDVPLMPMGEVAPLVRRPVKVKPDIAYHELGLRSFGKGTFHKPAIMGADLGSKRIFHIEPGDLLFSNVFAWEGAIAVAKPEDNGRVGSHRYITCVAKEGLAKASYFCFHFLTERGLQQIGEASPGSAGRNRTLGLKALENIQVPVPSFEKQIWFDSLVTKLNAIRAAQLATQQELDALMPSVLDRAFRGEL